MRSGSRKDIVFNAPCELAIESGSRENIASNATVLTVRTNCRRISGVKRNSIGVLQSALSSSCKTPMDQLPAYTHWMRSRNEPFDACGIPK